MSELGDQSAMCFMSFIWPVCRSSSSLLRLHIKESGAMYVISTGVEREHSGAE
jgi:hypothetical protein